ncbi:MAG: DUF2752 domain-containing protein [Bacteroidota bacterium]|nr:DUF2752 domain-containing protein [Bacteroidota bacterium]
MTRGKLYSLVLSMALVGGAFCWGFSLHCPFHGLCVFHAVTGIPCPACGTMRSINAIFHADIAGSMHYNPLGWIVLPAMILFPLWIIADYILKKNYFLAFYLWVENFLRKKQIYIPAILLILANWIWGISKGI